MNGIIKNVGRQIIRMSLAVICLEIVLISQMASAAKLHCEVLENLEVITQSTVNTTLGQKVTLEKASSIISFVTEKTDGTFLIEAFVPAVPGRFYAEGKIKSLEERLTASFWSRDAQYDVRCGFLARE